MHIVDISIIVAFLIATLYIGFTSGKKIKTFSDYAIGNRKFSDFAIFCTLAATAIGGSTLIGGVGNACKIGVTQLLALLGMLINFLVIGTFLTKRLSDYYGSYSLGDIFYKSHGITGKVLAGTIGFIYEIFNISVQFMAMGMAISTLTRLSYSTSLLISACIILIYTGRGGIRAVTFTDVLQFIAFFLIIPILFIVTLGKIGGFNALLEQLPKSHISISGENLHRYSFLILPLMLSTFTPIHIQRLLMTKNHKQGTKIYYNLFWVYLFMAVMIVGLGLVAKVLLPTLQKTDHTLFVLISEYLPVGVLGLAIVGVLAVLMSSADSILNNGSVILVNDIIIPYNRYIKKKELSEKEKLKWVRIASIFIGVSAIAFANQRVGLFETRILTRTLWMSIILAPLYFLIFNVKISTKGLFVSAIVGLTTSILWNINLKPITNVDGLLPGFFANVMTVLFFYFLGGRQKVFSKEELVKMGQAEALQIKKKPNVRDLQMRNNIFLGLCLVFLQLMPLVFEVGSLTYSKLILTLINGTMAILLIFGGSLELFAEEKCFQWLKLTTLFFCLPVSSTYLLLTSQENGLHILTLVLSFVVMLLSIEEKYEKKIIITCCLAIFTILLFYQKNNCILYWPETFSWQHSSYVFGYVAILFLLRSCSKTVRKEKELLAYRERYLMARSLSHDLMSPLMAFHMLVGNKKKIELDEKESQLLKNIANEMGSYIDDFVVGGLKDHAHLRLEDLNQCVLSCIEKQTILQPNFDIQLQAKETVFARVDAVLLRRIINNLVNVCRHALPNGCNTIVIAIDNDPLGNTQILLQAANGGFSQKALNSMFIEDQKLGDEVELGISFPEFQDIVAKWNGKLELISHQDTAIIQLLLPSKDHDKLIQKA